MTAASGQSPAGQPVPSDPDIVNSPDMPKKSQNDPIGTASQQPELGPAPAPIGGSGAVTSRAFVTASDVGGQVNGRR
jgi:hypothetical protein